MQMGRPHSDAEDPFERGRRNWLYFYARFEKKTRVYKTNVQDGRLFVSIKSEAPKLLNSLQATHTPHRERTTTYGPVMCICQSRFS
jgi:hypothetical protein